MIPFRIEFKTEPCVGRAIIDRNLAHAKSFPRAQRGEHVHPVAVCGGGPSLNEHLQELLDWPGDVWAINYTANYLLDWGIDCTLICVDPLIKSSRAKKRLIGTCCDPSLFDGEVQCFAASDHEEGGVPGGTTMAGRTPALALRLGYPGAVFFGCDSSFEDKDHVDRDEKLGDTLIIRANGLDFKTYPELSMQAEFLSSVLIEAPELFRSKSGGLLDAMVKDRDWEVVAVSTPLKKHLIELNGDRGLYDSDYHPICHECGQTPGHYDDCPVGM